MASHVVPENCIDKYKKLFFPLKRWWQIAQSWIQLVLINLHIGIKLIPFVTENYQSLPDNQKENISNMHHVFCGLHVLHNLCIHNEKAILEWEKIWNRKVVPMGDLKPQIVGHMIFCLKSPSYCPIVMGIKKVEKLIGKHIFF